MKLLLAFNSFLPRRLIVEIDNENWFAAGCPLRQRQLFRCRQPVRQRKLFRCWRHSFSSESQFHCSQLNFGSDLLQTTPLWQRIASSLQNTPLGSELLMRCRRHSFGSESPFAAQHTTRQRMLIRCSWHSFGSESQFRRTTHNSTANANSLQPTQFQQRITVSLHNTQLGSEC
jgi:hypothetical protein